MTAAGCVPAPSTGARTNQHYDLDPRLFELFLDSTLKYSSGLFASEQSSLEEAQQHKLAFITRELGLTESSSLLDVGCGWGSLLIYAARHFGCEAVGITPAPAQASVVLARAKQQGVADRVRVVVGSFGQVTLPRKAFDAVSFVGSIVHMPDKRATLDATFKLCRPNGRLYLSESCFRSERHHAEFSRRPGTDFVRDDIFGWGDMQPLSHYVSAAEDAGFSLSGLRDLTDDYRLTISRWAVNVGEHRDRIDAIAPGTADRLLRYLEISNAGWGYTTKHYALTAARRR